MANEATVIALIVLFALIFFGAMLYFGLKLVHNWAERMAEARAAYDAEAASTAATGA